MKNYLPGHEESLMLKIVHSSFISIIYLSSITNFGMHFIYRRVGFSCFACYFKVIKVEHVLVVHSSACVKILLFRNKLCKGLLNRHTGLAYAREECLRDYK